MKALSRHLRKFGPYVAVELIMPGGTLIALLMYWAENARARRRAAAEATA